MRERSLILAGLLLVILAVAGCGVGTGSAPGGVQLVVTQDFGTRSLADLPEPEAGGSDTVMRLLSRNLQVTTRYGGGFVQSVNGVSGGTAKGRPVDWFYYVNGVEAGEDQGACGHHRLSARGTRRESRPRTPGVELLPALSTACTSST